MGMEIDGNFQHRDTVRREFPGPVVSVQLGLVLNSQEVAL
jgi:hypothetical protein